MANEKVDSKKTLIITGASRGIGSAIASYFAHKEWQVINLSRHAPTDKNIHHITTDLANFGFEKDLETTLLPLIKNSFQLCLIHNSAMYHNDNIHSLEADVFRQVMEVNVIAANTLNRLLIDNMPASSSIIYIGSTLSEKAVPNAASYVVSKHAVAGLMKSTCQDLAGRDIHTCCICPGFTDTEMMQQHLKKNPGLLATLTEHVCMKRLVEPEEIARLAYFCANNPVINGAMLHANLGQVER